MAGPGDMMQERAVQCNDPSTGKQPADSSCEGRRWQVGLKGEETLCKTWCAQGEPVFMKAQNCCICRMIWMSQAQSLQARERCALRQHLVPRPR